MIANALTLKQIPFRYECRLDLGNLSFYPDFTICHPQTQKIFYWEHFGMMDDENYRQKTFQKLAVYGNNHIIPSINLLTTYETLENPLDSEKIDHVIEEYFGG